MSTNIRTWQTVFTRYLSDLNTIASALEYFNFGYFGAHRYSVVWSWMNVFGSSNLRFNFMIGGFFNRIIRNLKFWVGFVSRINWKILQFTHWWRCIKKLKKVLQNVNTIFDRFDWFSQVLNQIQRIIFQRDRHKSWMNIFPKENIFISKILIIFLIFSKPYKLTNKPSLLESINMKIKSKSIFSEILLISADS